MPEVSLTSPYNNQVSFKNIYYSSQFKVLNPISPNFYLTNISYTYSTKSFYYPVVTNNLGYDLTESVFPISLQINSYNFTYPVSSSKLPIYINNLNFDQNTRVTASMTLYPSSGSGSGNVKSLYWMRARKIADGSFVYWYSDTLDTTGANSGYTPSSLNDVCLVRVDT